MALTAIETSYAGCRFRSRLEARWAVFFDQLGVAWEYEPEGFETAAGWYLPDFRVELAEPSPTWTWFEVKPQDTSNDRRHDAFVASGEFLTVARGMPRDFGDQSQRDWLVTHDPRGGQPYSISSTAAGRLAARLAPPEVRPRAMRVWFYALPGAGRVINFSGDQFAGHGDQGALAVTAAYTAARSARFEHGERPR